MAIEVWLPLSDVLYGSITMFFASLTQVVSGFGLALLAVPLLSFFVSMQTVVVLVVLFSLLVNLVVVLGTRASLKLKEIWLLLLFSLLGIPVGILFVKMANPNVVKMIVGAMTLTTALLIMRGTRIQIRSNTVAMGITGFLSGFLNGSISMSGPPVVLFLANRGDRKDLFRGNLSAFAVGLNFITLISFAATGVLTTGIIRSVLELLPSVIIGTAVGAVVTKRIDEVVFRKIVLVLIIITGVAAIATGLEKLARS